MRKCEPSVALESEVTVFLCPSSLSDSFSNFPVCNEIAEVTAIITKIRNEINMNFKKILTSESQMRTIESSPALMIVLFRGPQIALLILPCGPLITRADSPTSATPNHNNLASWPVKQFEDTNQIRHIVHPKNILKRLFLEYFLPYWQTITREIV